MKEQKIIRILTYFYLVPFALIVGFNVINSFLRTTYFELYQVVETAKYKWDNPVLLAFAAAAVLAIFYLVMRSGGIEKANVEKAALIYSAAVCLFTVLLFRCVVTCDSKLVSDIAIELLQKNYQAFEQGTYLYRYPFQLGFIAFLELTYYVFGVENFISFQLINILCILVILHMLNKITGELFAEEKIRRIESVLSMGMFPLFLYATFIYGDLIGLSLGTCGIYFVIRYLKTDRWQDILKAAIFLSLGIVVKSNINIFVVAAVIAVVLNALQKKRYRMLVWALGILLISQVGIWIVNEIYMMRAGLDQFPQGIPKVAWIAMGMQEAHEDGGACGWYNGYNWAVYEECHFDQTLTTQTCMEDLKRSLGKFMHEQRYAINYFYKKFTSQWNSPTFMAMITNEWYSRHLDNLSPLAHFFIYGLGREILYQIMNVYHFFMFLCTGIYCWRSRRNWSLEKAYFILNIFGGFLFHMLWEAKARYVLGYFVLMLPLAAFGLNEMLMGLERWFDRRRSVVQ